MTLTQYREKWAAHPQRDKDLEALLAAERADWYRTGMERAAAICDAVVVELEGVDTPAMLGAADCARRIREENRRG